jgi:hypothetical protein
MYDKLVFVEGPTDEDVLREFAATLDVNLSICNAGFVAIGGARNFAHFAAESVMSFLSRRQVKCWFLLDRDEKRQEEIEKLREKLGANATLHVLIRRELENYLIVPRVLSEYISARKAATAKLSDEQTISHALTEVADSLKAYAIAKRVHKEMCGPIYSNLKLKDDIAMNGIETVFLEDLDKRAMYLVDTREAAKLAVKNAVSEIEQGWENEKLDRVPGAELLDLLFQRYGIRYQKDRDGVGIASQLKPHEIAAEIKTFLQGIGG